jgi:TetR/AcrR family transcriptional regulator of autoinduction and epiphytic fitness
MTTAPLASGRVTDGRSARSQRTRLAVVDALLDLLRGGNPRPTAKEIAERAGVSLRSVYVHFDDLDDLFGAATRRQIELVAPLLVVVPATGSVAERAETMMRARAEIFEELGPVRRAAELQEPFSPALARSLHDIRAAGRADLERVFAAELERLSTEERQRRAAVLDVLCGSVTWDQLRHKESLDTGAARATVVEAIISLLEIHR